MWFASTQLFGSSGSNIVTFQCNCSIRSALSTSLKDVIVQCKRSHATCTLATPHRKSKLSSRVVNNVHLGSSGPKVTTLSTSSTPSQFGSSKVAAFQHKRSYTWRLSEGTWSCRLAKRHLFRHFTRKSRLPQKPPLDKMPLQRPSNGRETLPVGWGKAKKCAISMGACAGLGISLGELHIVVQLRLATRWLDSA